MIEELLAKGYEGEDWDYKSDYPIQLGRSFMIYFEWLII